MSFAADARLWRELRSASHPLKCSGGPAVNNSAQAVTSSRSSLMLTTSVRFRAAPACSNSCRSIATVSASPANVCAPKSGRSGNSTHACLSASR